MAADSDTAGYEVGKSQAEGVEDRAVEAFDVICAAEQYEHEWKDVASNCVAGRKSIVTIFSFVEVLLQLELWPWLLRIPLMGRPDQNHKVVENYHAPGISRPEKPYRQ